MDEFTPITTQEQLNAVISDRLKRERETISKRYADYDDLKGKVSDYEKQIGDLTRDAAEKAKTYADYDRKLAERDAKIKGYETASVKTRIARELGIPYELAGRITGETEDEIRKDAETLSHILRPAKAAPLRSVEPASGTDSKTAALRALTTQLTSKGE